MKGLLKHLAQFIVARFGSGVKVFVDTAPVMEKPLAQRAGLGWQGKHTNLVSRQSGSWLFLGEIYTTLALPPDAPHADRCGSCARCLAACPTAAFPAPYRLDATRCISYLTIEHRGPIPLEFRAADRQPHLRLRRLPRGLPLEPLRRRSPAKPSCKPRHDLAAPPLAQLAALDDAAFRALFQGSPIKRIGRDRFVRNVLIAIGNSAELSLLPPAMHLLSDPDPVVAEAAAWAVQRLTRAPA